MPINVGSCCDGSFGSNAAHDGGKGSERVVQSLHIVRPVGDANEEQRIIKRGNSKEPPD